MDQFRSHPTRPFMYFEQRHAISSLDLGFCGRQRPSSQRGDYLTHRFFLNGCHFFGGTQNVVIDYKGSPHLGPVIKHHTSDANAYTRLELTRGARLQSEWELRPSGLAVV